MGDTYPKARVAATALAPVYWDREATTEKAIKYILEAGANGANIVGFGEAFIPGYPWWIWFGSPPWGRKFYAELFKNGVEIPSPTTDALCDAAKKAKIYVVIGINERKAGTLYCTQLYINPHGEIMGIRRKIKPTHCERWVWGDGGYLQVFDTEYGKISGFNCGEHFNPLARCAMYHMGEQIHIASWPSFSMKIGFAFTAPPAVNITRSMASEGALFVVCCTELITKEVIEKVCDTPEKAEMVEAGGAWTEIIAPNGEVISDTISGNSEGIVYADIDLEMILYNKNHFDHVGHYARPDLLQLLFNRETPTPVKEVGKITQTGKQLSCLLPSYESLKQEIEKSGKQELIDIALKFEQELKNVTEG
ncbi:carbon-nitrogen hydrolase family protein [Chloroflexota bacterium]